MGRRIGRVKVQKLAGSRKGSLTGKAKAVCAKQKEFAPSLPLQAGVQPSPGKQGSITHNNDLGKQTL